MLPILFMSHLQSWTKVLGHLHFFAENRPSSISPSPLPLSMLYQWAESALFRSNIDQGGGGTSLCANATLQSVEDRAISEHVSYFQAVPRTFVQDCSYYQQNTHHASLFLLLSILDLSTMRITHCDSNLVPNDGVPSVAKWQHCCMPYGATRTVSGGLPETFLCSPWMLYACMLSTSAMLLPLTVNSFCWGLTAVVKHWIVY